MMTLCHNCHNAIPPGSAFCPECGAPQLRVPEPSAAEPEQGTGEPTPRHMGEIAWPAALRSAAIFAVPAGLLLSFLSLPVFDMVWVMLGSVWTLRRYRRAAGPARVLTPLLGGRIGLVLGLFVAFISTMCDAVTLVVERYGLHRGAAIDARLTGGVQAGIDRIHASNPDAAAQLPGLFHFWLSSEGRATLLLVSAGSSVLTTLFFGWLAGRLAVRYGGLRRRSR